MRTLKILTLSIITIVLVIITDLSNAYSIIQESRMGTRIRPESRTARTPHVSHRSFYSGKYFSGMVIIANPTGGYYYGYGT